MNFSLVSDDPALVKSDALILPVFEEDEALASLDARLEGHLSSALDEEGFKGKPDQLLSLFTQEKLPSRRLVVVGLGPRARFVPEHLRAAVGRAVRSLSRSKLGSLAVVIPSAREGAPLVRAAVEGVGLGFYRFDKYRSSGKDERPRPPGKIALVLPDGLADDAAARSALKLGVEVFGATNWARDLVNEPAAHVTPTRLAEEARAMAKEVGLKCVVAGRKQIERLRMGMFLGVAQGSQEEPQLIHLTYAPQAKAGAGQRPMVLVGKAITFDSGGLSLKTVEGMADMKTDMAGAAAVLATMRVVAHLAPPFPVHALMGACENMPSGTAYRPGDILVSRLGKTVEITNTDAEGRLVLGDVLAYGAELEPSLMVDLATLTGACMIALGHHVAGAFADDDEAVYAVAEAARRAGEEVWRLPLQELQREALKSDVADMKNAGDRWGGAISAGLFLREFVGQTPWVHLDIAGPSQSPRERAYFGKGATGFGVRTLVELIRSRAEASQEVKRRSGTRATARR